MKPFGLETVPEADSSDCDNVGSTSPAGGSSGLKLQHMARMSTLHEEKTASQDVDNEDVTEDKVEEDNTE